MARQRKYMKSLMLLAIIEFLACKISLGGGVVGSKNLIVFQGQFSRRMPSEKPFGISSLKHFHFTTDSLTVIKKLLPISCQMAFPPGY